MSGDDLETARGAPQRFMPDGLAPLSAPIDIPWGALALGGIGLIAMSLAAFVVVTDERAAAMQAVTVIERTPPKRISAPEHPKDPSRPAPLVAEGERGSTAVSRTFRAGPPAPDFVIHHAPALAER